VFWKDELAKLILHASNYELQDAAYMKDLSMKFPKIRYKTVDSRGSIFVIRFEETKEWLKPVDWANIHLSNLRSRFRNDLERLVVIEESASVLQELKVDFPDYFDAFDSKIAESQRIMLESRESFRFQQKRIDELLIELRLCEDQKRLLEERISKANKLLLDNATFTCPKAIKDLAGKI